MGKEKEDKKNYIEINRFRSWKGNKRILCMHASIKSRHIEETKWNENQKKKRMKTKKEKENDSLKANRVSSLKPNIMAFY